MRFISSVIIGRESEVARVEQLLDRAHTGTAALLIEGEAGIGKTSLIDEALRRGRDAGFRVMACRAAHREATMSYACLSDLLAEIEVSELSALPAPQRRAIEVATLRRDVGSRPVDRRAVAAGFLSIIRHVTAEAALMVVVDDLHCMDAASAAVLDFIVRRIEGLPFALIAAVRPDEIPPVDVSNALQPERLVRLQLGPMQTDHTLQLLRERVRADITRAEATMLHVATSGNPFFAIEVAVAMNGGPGARLDDTLPIPADIRDLVAQRAARYPAPTRSALLAVALLADPSPTLLAAAIGHDVLLALEPAETDGLVVIRAERVRFAHPLHAAAVSAGASAHERRAMHLRLASVASEAEERARHLAAATLQPDADIASALDEGAAAARGRSAIDSAARLLSRASELTPSDQREVRDERAVRAAELLMRAGDRAQARHVLDELLGRCPTPEAHADALRIVGELEFSENDLASSERALTAARDLTNDPRLAGRVELNLAFLNAARYDFAAAAQSAQRAAEHLRGASDSALLAEAWSYGAMTMFLCGGGVDWNAVEHAVALEDPEAWPSIGMSATAIHAVLHAYVGRHDEARELLAAVHDDLLERGNDVDRAQILIWWSWLEARTGNLQQAAQLADRATSLAGVVANTALVVWSIAQRALVAALQGDLAGASSVARTAVPADAIQQVASWRAAATAACELPRGNSAAAWDACRAIVEPLETLGFGEPVPLFLLPDAIEALADVGQLDRAAALADALETRGRELDRTWALATGARCRSIVAAARADLSEAVAAADEALQHHERIDLPIDRARVLLVQGSALRRQRQWAQARNVLEISVAEFDRTGAVLWRNKARAELERVAGRRPRAEDALTPTEQRVAELAVQGMANKAIARALSISVSTVESHLSRVYGKLGVRSRAELALLNTTRSGT